MAKAKNTYVVTAKPDPVFGEKLKAALFEHFEISSGEDGDDVIICEINAVCHKAQDMGVAAFKTHMMQSLDSETSASDAEQPCMSSKQQDTLRKIWAAALVEAAAIEVKARKLEVSRPEPS